MKTVLNTLGASNLSEKERSALDFYSTNPKSVRALLDKLELPKDKIVWDPGSGHSKIIDTLKEYGYKTKSTDIHDYGYQDEILDFLAYEDSFDGTIFGNPPYKLATEFVKHALDVVITGNKVIFFLRTLFLEGQKRYKQIFKNAGLKTVWVFIDRQVCSATDAFDEGSAVSYSFFEFEKGYTGEPTIKWLATTDIK